MKKLLVASAFALAAASPAFGATHHWKNSTNADPSALNAYDAADYAAVHDPDAVVFDNKVLGRDPDPNVRLEIRRELPGYYD